MKSRIRIVSIVVLALLGAMAPSVAADPPSFDEEWVQSAPATVGLIGINTQASVQAMTYSSYLLSLRGTTSKVDFAGTCSSLSDPNCLTWDRLQFRSDLQPCSPTIPSDCFNGLIVKDSNGKEIPSTLVADAIAPLKQSYTGSPDKNLPTGGAPLIFSIPGAAHSGGDLYMVKPDLVGALEKGQEKFKVIKLEAVIVPVKKVTGDTGLLQISDTATDYATIDMIAGDGREKGTMTCDFFKDGKTCFVTQAFPVGITFGMKLRLSQSVYGWLHGRLRNPDVSVAPNPIVKDGVDLTIISEPMRVPVLFGWTQSANAPAGVLARYSGVPRLGTVYGAPGKAADRNGPLSEISMLHEQLDASESSLAEVRDWLDVLGDKATVEPYNWSVQTMVGGSSEEINKCTKDSKALAGIVSTNATMYSPGAPTFNKESQSLDYKVVAPHFAHNGDVFLGTYDLLMSSQVARCIYSFSKAPISATISIVSSDGNTRVATTSINEKNGFLHLGAYGFEFSSPTIKVTLKQEPVKEVIAPVRNSAKRTITCLLGKTTKKITALKPVCPKGYKLKK